MLEPVQGRRLDLRAHPLRAADDFHIESLKKTLCAFLVKEPTVKDAQGVHHCMKDAAGEVTNLGDACIATGGPATPDCADAMFFEAELTCELSEVVEAGSGAVFDACSLDVRLKIIAKLLGVVGVELVLAPEERPDHVGLHGMDRGAYERLVDRLQVHLSPKHDIRGVLDLSEPPIVCQLEHRDGRTKEPRIVDELLVHKAGVGLICQLLCGLSIGAGTCPDPAGEKCDPWSCRNAPRSWDTAPGPKGSPRNQGCRRVARGPSPRRMSSFFALPHEFT